MTSKVFLSKCLLEQFEILGLILFSHIHIKFDTHQRRNAICLCLFFFQQANQIRPVLVNRSTSPLIKEVHVKSANNQTTQVDISCFDGSCRLSKESSEGNVLHTIHILSPFRQITKVFILSSRIE